MNKPQKPGAPVIRNAVATDQDRIRALVFAVLDEYEIEPAPKTTDRDLNDIEQFYKTGMFAVMENGDGDLIGTVGFASLSATVCELRKMYLKPSGRGRGYGAQLLKYAIGKARGMGFERIELSTKRVMEEAIGLYTKYGFKTTDSKPVDLRCDQTLVLKLN
ncbi:MAG: GNAT family N-acetyltransferase [Pseudomonadota bacterium]